MSYAVENALFQWEEGERRMRSAEDHERADLERAAAAVLDELRRRLGSSFTIRELTDLYAGGSDWASALARSESAGTDAPWVVDAAFARYAREAEDFAGGRPHERAERARDG
jgi:hypothetical protein